MRGWWCWLVLMLCGCSVEVVDHPPISPSRPVGAACHAGDSASVKRAAYHPLGPTGGWGRGAAMEAGREPKASEMGLNRVGGRLTGFVRVEEAGELRARSYDDSYGEVYCGWSPERLELKPGVARVSLGACAVGDGGLKQVLEVCWFPRGESRGRVVYSSAHGGAKQNAAEVYVKEDLGSPQYFNSRQALEVIAAARAMGDRELARKAIEDSLQLLDQQLDLVDGATGKKIPAREHYGAVRKQIEALRD